MSPWEYTAVFVGCVAAGALPGLIRDLIKRGRDR